ncbi:MAG TPA: YSC84-related protein [Anaeromyxobacteraceae bacterium]|nr:YSC84-related protein [Anaeromyxobacteraceae bacterium]
MKKQIKTTVAALVALAVGAAAVPAFAGEPAAKGSEAPGKSTASERDAVKDAEVTVATFRRKDPSLGRFFSSALGYAVFPSVGKGGAGVGGAYGTGVLFERGKPTGRASLTQVTIGPQIGGQAYSEVVFFQTRKAIADFKKGELTMAAQVSAVAVKAGASANARYARGVAVFTLTQGGLMAEASVGGQRFDYRQFANL